MSERVRHIHLEPFGGAAGDMFIAALLDACPELEAACCEAIRAAGLPPAWRVSLQPHRDGALAGRRFLIEPAAGAREAPDERFQAILALVGAAPLEPGVARRASAIIELIGRAEAAVHGVALERVHFHELADWDSIADVVGAACLIEALAPVTFSLGPLPLGRGRIQTRHGPLPVPAPATARLLEGLPVHDDGIAGERVTPTGAAIMRHLEPLGGLPPGRWRAGAVGYGFGSRRLAGLSNTLRASIFEADPDARQDERIAVLAFEVDDQTPEMLAIGLDHLRAADGVLDVVQIPAFGKKGRLVTRVQVLARPERLDGVIDRCFAQTTTIGLRYRIEARAILPRAADEAGGLPVKVVRRPGGRRTVKVEAEATRELEDHAAREARRRGAERGMDREDD
jgi:uncharacterized protein (TIGR00299 family) protein